MLTCFCTPEGDSGEVCAAEGVVGCGRLAATLQDTQAAGTLSFAPTAVVMPDHPPQPLLDRREAERINLAVLKKLDPQTEEVLVLNLQMACVVNTRC